jgi:hypothetical protein
LHAGIRLALLLILVPTPAWAQGFLDRFSYEGLRLSGIALDLGVVTSDRLATELTGSLRLDWGFIAPHIRTLLGGSYFRSRFDDDEVALFESRLRRVVSDPEGNATVSIGTIGVENFSLDLDLQYLPFESGKVIPYIGVGLGVHVRDAEGSAIEDTFVEDALQTIGAALNLSLGLEFAVTARFRFITDFRGTLSSGLSLASGRAGFMYRIPRSEP